MIRKPFFGIVSPKLSYDAIADNQPEPVTVFPREKITLFIDTPFEKSSKALLRSGDAVKSGEKLRVYPDSEPYAISPVAGKIDSVMPFIGIMEKKMTAITVRMEKASGSGEDDSFRKAAKTPDMETLRGYLATIPGNPDFSRITQAGKPVKTIVVLGADNDLLTITNQFVIKTGITSVKAGIDILRKITGIQNVILVVPAHLVKVAGAASAGVKTVGNNYPAAHPEVIAFRLLGEEGGAVGSGIAFFSAEAVSEIGNAVGAGRIPTNKRFTFVGKDGIRKLVSAPIGTHVGDILETFGEKVDPGDRIIFGGPMTGSAIYSLEHPVQPDTDTIIVQDRAEIVASTDAYCINCGQCVRVCPTNVPVNELIRYLDAGEYEAAAERTDLDACIECGYCTYVCEGRIPIFQYIRLAKNALERMKTAEEENA